MNSNIESQRINLENMARNFSKHTNPHQTNFNNTKSSKYFKKNIEHSSFHRDNLTVTNFNSISTIRINFGTLRSINSLENELDTKNTPSSSKQSKEYSKIMKVKFLST